MLGKATDPGILLFFMGRLFQRVESLRTLEKKKSEVKHNLDQIISYKFFVTINIIKWAD